MNILIQLTYYRPHVSGLTIYVERLARGLAGRGHGVTVLTSQFDPGLPREEVVDGVRVVRVPVMARVSKGVLMPSIGFHATRLVAKHDVSSLHLPNFDAAGIALRGRLFGRPVIATYHCDLQLPAGLLNRMVGLVAEMMNRITMHAADRVLTYTEDYRGHSPLLHRNRHKVDVIAPPVEMRPPEPDAVREFQRRHRISDGPLIGMACRFAAEKGIEHMVAAIEIMVERYPNVQLLLAGPYRDVLGEKSYFERLQPRIERLGKHWRFLGLLGQDELPEFYGSLDALVVASTNRTESFGLVQVEALLCNCPVVAPNIPGVRQVVLTTGMGAVVPAGDGRAIADALSRLLVEGPPQRLNPAEIRSRFSVDRCAAGYEALFARELKRKVRR
jgi:glycosyltransferase involved in cell wall biosynthesis